MAEITEDYVSLEIAELLKDKGFNEPTWTRYEDDNEVIFGDKYDWNNSPMGQTSAPTHQMTMKWLRKIHKIHITIGYAYKADANLTDDYVSYCFETENAKTLISYTQNEWYDTYEQACEAAIKYCLENLI